MLVYCWSLAFFCPPHSPSVSSLNQFLFTAPLSAPSISCDAFLSAPVLFIPFILFLHLSVSSQTLAGSSCWNMYWSVFLFSLSLSLLYLFSSVSLSLVQSKATRCSAASCQKRRDSISRPNPFSVFNSLVSRQRVKVGRWCNGTRVSDSGPRVEGPALPNNPFPNRFLNSSTVQNTLKTRSFTVLHIKIRFQRICIFSCMLKTRWKESNGVRKINLIHDILYLNKTALVFDRGKSLGMHYMFGPCLLSDDVNDFYIYSICINGQIKNALVGYLIFNWGLSSMTIRLHLHLIFF